MSRSPKKRTEVEEEPVRVLGRGLRARRGVHLTLRTLREASDKSIAEEHRGMCAKEGCVHTGSPMPWARAQPEAREGEAGRYRVAERSVAAGKRVTTIDRRGLRATQPE